MPLMRILKAVTLATVLTAVLPAQAQNHAAPWLRMGVGARAMAMGTAQTAIVSDATATYWNPAALSGLRAFEASLMYTAGMKAERTYNFVSAALRAQRLGTFGLSWMNAGITGIKRFDEGRNYLGTMDVGQNAFQLSYGRALADGLALGASAKYLQEDLGDNSGYGVDVGLLFKPYDELQFGAMVRDIAGETGRDKVPYEARLGIGFSPIRSVTVAADLIQVKESDGTAAVGASYQTPINEHTDFWFGIGRNDLSHGRGFTAGFGLGFHSFAVQYAYVTEPQAFLDVNHRLSVNFFLDGANPLKSLFGPMRRLAIDVDARQEIIHRHIIEGTPTIKLQIEVLDTKIRDSIRTIWSEPGGVVSFPGVNFAIGSAEISDEFARVLDGAAQLIMEHPEIQLLEIQGHTDSTGNDAINIPLGKARAQSVRNYLISRGVDAQRLVANGYGATRPIASNATEQGRYQNRRIDILRLR